MANERAAAHKERRRLAEIAAQGQEAWETERRAWIEVFVHASMYFPPLFSSLLRSDHGWSILQKLFDLTRPVAYSHSPYPSIIPSPHLHIPLCLDLAQFSRSQSHSQVDPIPPPKLRLIRGRGGGWRCCRRISHCRRPRTERAGAGERGGNGRKRRSRARRGGRRIPARRRRG